MRITYNRINTFGSHPGSYFHVSTRKIPEEDSSNLNFNIDCYSSFLIAFFTWCFLWVSGGGLWGFLVLVGEGVVLLVWLVFLFLV